MKTTLANAALTKMVVGAALLLAPVPAFAQAAAGAVPNSFDNPAAAQAQTPARPAAPAVAPASSAPDIARSQDALRSVIAAGQDDGFDYSVFTDNLAAQIRQQSAQVGPLLKSFGEVKTIEYQRQEGPAELFKVTFDNQVTEWLIGFDADNKIAALLFRPAEG